MGTLSLPRAVLPPWRALCLYAWSIGVRVVQKYLRYKEELANYPKILLSEDSRKLPVPGHAFRLKGQDPLVWLPQRTVASYGLTPCSDFGTRPGSSSCASLPLSLPDLHPLFLLYFLPPEFWYLCEAFHVSQCRILFKAKWSLSECAVLCTDSQPCPRRQGPPRALQEMHACRSAFVTFVPLCLSCQNRVP